MKQRLLQVGLIFLLCGLSSPLIGCAKQPTDGVVKAASDNCTAMNKQLEISYNLGGGYTIKCTDAK